MVCPGGVLVVGLSGLEAAVEDADEPVGECSESFVVGVASGSPFVVEGSGAGTGRECGKRPQVADISETPVTGVSSQHDLVFAGTPGDRRRCHCRVDRA